MNFWRGGRIALITPDPATAEFASTGVFGLRVLTGQAPPASMLTALLAVVDPDGSLRKETLQAELASCGSLGTIRVRRHEGVSGRAVYLLERLRKQEFGDVKQEARLWVSCAGKLNEGIEAMRPLAFWLLADAAQAASRQDDPDTWVISEAKVPELEEGWASAQALLSGLMVELPEVGDDLLEEVIDLSQRVYDPEEDEEG